MLSKTILELGLTTSLALQKKAIQLRLTQLQKQVEELPSKLQALACLKLKFDYLMI